MERGKRYLFVAIDRLFLGEYAGMCEGRWMFRNVCALRYHNACDVPDILADGLPKQYDGRYQDDNIYWGEAGFSNVEASTRYDGKYPGEGDDD